MSKKPSDLRQAWKDAKGAMFCWCDKKPCVQIALANAIKVAIRAEEKKK